jgi:hypothetical protein
MPGPTASKAPVQGKAVVNKTAAGMPHLVPGHAGEHGVTGPDDHPTPLLSKEQPGSLPQMRLMHPHVDVAGKNPPTAPVEKKANAYALGSRYPLDSYEQILAAVRYFDDYGRRFAPADRHEYCSNLMKRASAVGIPVSYGIRRYGSGELASGDEVKMAFDQRRLLVLDDSKLALLDALEKVAMGRNAPELHTLIGALDEFDKQAGLDFHYDRDLMDPYFSLLGAKKEADAEDVSFTVGNDHTTGRSLVQLSRTSFDTISKIFGAELAKEFQKDPIGIFKSLPNEQKKVMMRMSEQPPSGV